MDSFVYFFRLSSSHLQALPVFGHFPGFLPSWRTLIVVAAHFRLIVFPLTGCPSLDSPFSSVYPFSSDSPISFSLLFHLTLFLLILLHHLLYLILVLFFSSFSVLFVFSKSSVSLAFSYSTSSFTFTSSIFSTSISPSFLFLLVFLCHLYPTLFPSCFSSFS